MIGQSQFTEVIEHLRLQKKLTYQYFLEGIVSERSYRRYVNEGKSFSFEVLVSLVDKLNMRMRDFIIYALNHISIKHQDEIYLSHYLDHEMFDAATPYLERVHPPFYTHLGKIILPLLLKRYEYKNNRIDKYQYIDYLKSQIQLEQIQFRKTVDRNTIKVLLFILQDGILEDQQKVIPILINVMLGEKQLISHQYDIDLNTMIQTLVKILFSNAFLKEVFSDHIDQIFQYASRYVKQYHLDEGLIAFFSSALNYIKKEDALFPNYVIYYLMIKKLQKSDYKIKDDSFLLNIVKSDDLKDIILNTNYESVYFMKHGDH